MTNPELLETIQNVVREILNNQSMVVTGESRFMDDLGLESIDLLDLSSELENSIGKELDFKDLAEYSKNNGGTATSMKDITVNNLIQYIEANP